MKYKDYNDFELIQYIKESNEEASDIVFEKYRPLIVNMATKMISCSPNLGLEINDLIQEGMIGLNMAINSFNDSEETLFYTYAKKCIERKMISSIIGAQRQKHKILNESMSLEIYDSDDESKVIESLIADNSYNPEALFVESESQERLIKKIEDVLAPFEQQVFELKISGFQYKEIAEILDKDVKSIDNALNRIKTKIKKILEQDK